MQHVKGAFDDLARLDFLEPSRLARSINLDELFAKVQLCAVLLDVAHERGNELFHAEDHAARIAEFDVYIFQNFRAAPVIGGQVHGLLRRACAFDRHGRLGENGRAGLKSLHQLPSVGREIVAVV